MTNEEAIDILRNAAWLGTDADREQIENAVEMAINALTAQPETHEERTETHACDCISRQAAINVIAKWMLEYGGYGEEHGINALKQAAEEIKALPFAQPEIVRCKDCKWFHDIGCAIQIVDDTDKPSENDYCSFAERRIDEQTV